MPATALKERPRAKSKAAPSRRKPIDAQPAKDAEPHTLVTLLLDRTGSMESIKSATIESFNAYLSGLQKNPEGIEFTFLQFDSVSLDKICVAQPVALVPLLNDKTYQPRAGTPLIDACMKTINAVAASLESRKDKPKVVICFQTDGEENQSVEHPAHRGGWQTLNNLIAQKTAGGWQFVFLGVGIDAYKQGALMGIARDNTVAASKDPDMMRAAYGSMSCNTVGYASGALADMSFSSEQKMMSGDVFDTDLQQKLNKVRFTGALGGGMSGGAVGGKPIDLTSKS